MWNIEKIGVAICLVIFLSLFSVSAQQQTLGSFTQNQCVNILQTCTNCTFVNITSIELAQPISYQFEGELSMQQNGKRYNYTFCNTSTIGEYYYWTYGDPDGVLSDPVGVNFFVSPVGLQQTTSQSIGSLAFLILMIVLMFVFGFIGFKLFKNNTWWVLGLFLTFFASLLLIYNTYLGYQYHRLFTGLPDSGVPETIFWILFAVILIGFFTSVALLFLNWKKVFRYIKREIKRKDPDDASVEDWDYDTWGGEKWDLPRTREQK